MNRHDWQQVYGNAPGSFRADLLKDLNSLEEEQNMKKRYKISTAIALAAVLTLLMAGAAFASAQFGLLEHFGNYADPITPLDGAENLIVTNLGAAENDYIRVEVEEAMFDGRNAQFQLRISPKDSANYALLPDVLPDTPEDEYIIEKTEFEDGSYDEKIVGRKDGRTILKVHCTPEIADNKTISGSSYDYTNNEDGSITMWSSHNLEDYTASELTITLTSRLWVNDKKVAVDPITFTLPKNETEQVFTMQVAENSSIEGFEFLPGEAAFTKLRSYITVNYAHDQLKDDSMGYTFALLDADGNELPGDGGWTDWSAEGGKQINMDVIHAQALNPIPETITLKCWEIGNKDNPIGTITFTLTPIE